MTKKNKIIAGVIASIAIIVTLVSCEQGKSPAADDYTFEAKEFEHTDISLKVVVIPDEKKFNELKAKYAPGVDGLQAFSAINPMTKSCTVYIKDPNWEYQPEFIGHELAHCIWGRWHNNRDKEEALEGRRG